MALPGSTKYKVGLVFDIERTGFMRGLREINTKVEESRQKMEKNYGAISRSITNVGQKFLVATAAIVGFGIAAVKTAADFERSMNRVGAVSGATEEQLASLTEQAMELGRTTMFSATQAADAMSFLAMAGFSVNEIMGAMPSTLQLAAAAQIDLAQAADITSNILTGYRMTVEQLGHANDVLVKTFTSTNTNLAQLGEAMKFVAPVAASAGIQFEETAAALGLMGNAGIQASLAGTSLRGAIVRLLTPGGEAAAIMERLGINALDSAGNLVSLVDIIEQLEKTGATTADMMTIFGLRAGPAMSALVSQGSDALRELIIELENSGGTAQRIADKQMEGLHGQLLKLKSAFESFMIGLADSGLIQWVTDVATKFTEWISAMAKYDKQTLKTIIVVAAIVAAIGPLLIALGSIVLIAPAVGTAVTIMFGPWGLIIAGVVTGLVLLTKHIIGVKMAAKEQREELEKNITTYTRVRDEIIALAKVVKEFDEATGDAEATIKELNDRFIEIIKVNPEMLVQLGLTIDNMVVLDFETGNVVDTMIEWQAVMDKLSTVSAVEQLNQFIRAQRSARLELLFNEFALKRATVFGPDMSQQLAVLDADLAREQQRLFGPGPVVLPVRPGPTALSPGDPGFTGPLQPLAPAPPAPPGGGGSTRAAMATEDNTEAVISLEDEIAKLTEAFFEVPELIFRGMTTGADVAFGDFLDDMIAAFRAPEPPGAVPGFDPTDAFRPFVMGGNVLDKVRDFFVDFTDAMENGLMHMEKMLFRTVGQFAADLVSGNVGAAIRGAFIGLANYIGAVVAQSVTASTGGGGMWAGIAGAAAGGAVGAGIAILGSLLFPSKQPGSSKALPIYASITNWNEQNLGAFLPFTFMASGRAGLFDVDYRGASLDRMRQGRRLGFHYAQ